MSLDNNKKPHGVKANYSELEYSVFLRDMRGKTTCDGTHQRGITLVHLFGHQTLLGRDFSHLSNTPAIPLFNLIGEKSPMISDRQQMILMLLAAKKGISLEAMLNYAIEEFCEDHEPRLNRVDMLFNSSICSKCEG